MQVKTTQRLAVEKRCLTMSCGKDRIESCPLRSLESALPKLLLDSGLRRAVFIDTVDCVNRVSITTLGTLDAHRARRSAGTWNIDS